MAAEDREYHRPKGFTGDEYRSFAVADIANWLSWARIPFEYRRRYPIKSYTAYRPDFWIVGTDVYIEFWALDRNGDPVPNVGMDRESYHRMIDFRRTVHQLNGTHLIEIYDWMRHEQVMYETLEKELARYGITAFPSSLKRRVKAKDRKRGSFRCSSAGPSIRSPSM